MKFCPNCGTQTDDSHPFCSKCGYKFAPVQQNPNAFAYQTPPVQTNPQMPIKKKKSKAPLIIAIVAVVVLAVLAALFFFTNVFGNHVVQLAKCKHIQFGEVRKTVEREYDGNGDMISQIICNYYFDTGDLDCKFVITYEYDGKHNLIGYTEKVTSYDDSGKAGETDVRKYDVEGYKEDGFWYYDVYDEYHNFMRTDVYDKHRNLIRQLDKDGYISYEAEYEYDFYGRILSLEETWYYEDSDSESNTIEFEYDGDKMIGTLTSDYDGNAIPAEYLEFVFDWNFYYFW